MADDRRGLCAVFYYEGGIAGEKYTDIRMDGDPLRVILGAQQVIPGIESALYEMEIGETRLVTIEPEKGYGDYDPEGVRVYPRLSLPPACVSADVGDILTWTNPASGMPIPVRVIEATPEAVKLDFNHPFAGKTLEYRLKLIDVAR